MARICNPKAKKKEFGSEPLETKNILMNCQLKLKYPPETPSGGFLPALRRLKQDTEERNAGLDNIQNLFSKGNPNSRCCYEEWKKLSELRKKKLVEKLRRVYEINTEGLTEHTMNEVIRKMQMLEKEKRDREKRKVEKTVVMIRRLIEDQKYKRRGWGIKFNKLPWRRSLKTFSSTEALCESATEETEKFEEPEIEEEEEEEQEVYTQQPSFRMKHSYAKDEEKKSIEEKGEVILLPEGLMDLEVQDLSDVVEKKSITEKISIEKQLQSTPARVVFQDFKKDKFYYQDLKVTNVGLDKIHCRLLGVGVYSKTEDRFPVGVAVRDSVKLRPGCSYSTKVRFCIDDNTKEIACSIVYETRRKFDPTKHSWFLIPVLCIPARAIIKVTPFKLVFPSITWCTATGAEGNNALKKVLRIQNTGAKGCSCKISKQSLSIKDELEEIMGEDRVIDEGTSTENQTSASRTQDESEEEKQKSSKGEDGEQEFPEQNIYLRGEATNAAYSLVEELFDNVFANFRFSEKYHIEIPPLSTKLVEVRFIPEYRGFHHENQFIQFEGCYNCTEEKIELMGDIIKLPLRIEPQVVDLQICVANTGIYSEVFKIFNDSKGPYMVRLKIPSSVKNHAHIYPRTAIIQPFSSREFSVRIYPRVTLANDAPRYYNEASGIFEFPIFVHPANFDSCKSDYIKLYVCALITDYALELQPSNIDLGTVNTLETVWTEITLTNHSLAAQEFGFLNLPKGARVEPNMGFGTILPKETITLYFLYSPGPDVLKSSRKQGDHFFDVKVTSIAEYGGFREKIEPESESWEPFESTWKEESGPKLEQISEAIYSEAGDEEISSDEKSEDYAFCEDRDFSIEEEEINRRLNRQEEKIREFLKDDEEVSESSFHTRAITAKIDREPSAFVFLRNRNATTLSQKTLWSVPAVIEEEGEGYLKESGKLRSDINVIKCGAFVVVPFCQISQSVIQLPATPCSSVSLYCFRLECGTVPDGRDCNCGFIGKRKTHAAPSDGVAFAGRFEFQYDCPHIKLEPGCGFFKAGDSLPITIIYRPEFPAEQLYHESKALKTKKVVEESNSEREVSFLKGTGIAKRKRSQIIRLTSDKVPEAYEAEKMVSYSFGNLNKYDLFAAERTLQEMASPFSVETKVQCVIKVVQQDNPTPRTETHNMVVVCPAIKPNFIYLGRSQEINFGKVLVGTRPKIPLKIQNISFERITPVMSLLNPVGPFSCPAALRRTKVDPEHVWTQPLMYAPLEVKGIEREFFEIHSGPTNLFLTVTGEAVMPKYKFTPDFSCCCINLPPGQSGDIQVDIENGSPAKMNLKFVCDFLKESVGGEEVERSSIVETNVKPNKKEKRKKDEKPKKKLAETEKKSLKFLDEIPEEIWLEVETLQDFAGETSVFGLVGVNERDEVGVAANGKSQVKIRFSPPKLSTKKYAVKYKVLLEGITFLKEILIIGTSAKGKLSP